MKTTIKSLLIVLFGFFLSLNVAGKEKKNASLELKVEGVCNMCKKRIENAALIKGVKLAEWDKKTKILTVVYVTKKTDSLTIKKSIASAGHDAGTIKAKDSAYKTLPDCCAYRDGVPTH